MKLGTGEVRQFAESMAGLAGPTAWAAVVTRCMYSKMSTVSTVRHIERETASDIREDVALTVFTNF